MSNLLFYLDENKIISEINKNIKPDRIGGDIHLIIDGNAFPFDRWYDYPVTILSWWLENCVKLNSESENLVENYFMDGPYEFWVEKISDIAELKFYRRDSGEEDEDDDIYVEVRSSLKILFEDYKKELSQTGNKMLNIFDRKNVLGEEIEHLKFFVKSLS